MIERVNSKESFLEFVAALRADLEASRAEEQTAPSSPYSPAARGWENPDLGRFLEAMQAWTCRTRASEFLWAKRHRVGGHLRRCFAPRRLTSDFYVYHDDVA